jgi:peptidoglycan/xylan/chitin deacetylase (PgdA/CDA1 family)
LLCAGAIAGGALVSHLTDTGAHAAASAPSGQLPPASPVRPVVGVRARDAEPVLDPIEVDPRSLEPRLPHPGPFAEGLRDGKVITGATAHRFVLFTFDDGPDLRNTPRLLDTLDELDVKAVFFLTASRLAGNGPWSVRNQELAREILRRGHVVGNHTVDHAQLPLLSDESVLSQVSEADAIFERTLGERTWLVRPPGGARSERVDALLASRGYTQVLWNLGSGDFQVRSAEDVFRVWRRVLQVRGRDAGERGGVVLLHDTHEWSVEALPMIVSWIREQNCRLLDEGEELYDIVGDPSVFFVPRGDDSSSAEAPPAAPDPRVIEIRQRRLRSEAHARCARLASR